MGLFITRLLCTILWTLTVPPSALVSLLLWDGSMIEYCFIDMIDEIWGLRK